MEHTSLDTSNRPPGPEGRSRRWRVYLFIVLLTFLLYGLALRLGFFFDDMVHFRWLDGHALTEVWTSAKGLGYYRPLPFTLWLVLHRLFGYYHAFVLHLLNVALHALNAILLYQLAQRQFEGQSRWLYGAAAASLFVTYPFSYQAVPYVNALCHPLAAFLILSSIAAYWEAQARPSKLWSLGSLLLACLAPFAHETGVLIAPLLIVMGVLGPHRSALRSMVRSARGYLAISLGYALIWVMVPKGSGDSLGLPRLESLWQNGVYFLQGLALPTAPLAKVLMRWFSFNDLNSVAVMAVVTLLCVLVLCVRPRRQVTLALLWFAISVLPAWLMLPFSYVIDGPRLLYLASIGNALLWAGVLAALWCSPSLRRLGPWLAALALLALLWRNVAFVNSRMQLYASGNDMLMQAVEAARTSPVDASLLYVNMPAWLAFRESAYVLGHEGVTLIPGYTRLQDAIWVNGGGDRKVRGVTFANTQKDWRNHVGHYDPEVGWEGLNEAIRGSDMVYVTDYAAAELRIREAGALARERETKPDGQTVLALWGQQVALLRGSLERQGLETTFTLWWKCLRETEAPYTVFVHVYDGEGHLVAQKDGYPLLGMFPFWLWRKGDLVRDRRPVSMPTDLRPGRYVVSVGLYDPDTGQRVPAFSSDGARYPEDSVSVLTLTWGE